MPNDALSSATFLPGSRVVSELWVAWLVDEETDLMVETLGTGSELLLTLASTLTKNSPSTAYAESGTR